MEPLLEKKDSGEDMPTLVIATVEGDIHDIGTVSYTHLDVYKRQVFIRGHHRGRMLYDSGNMEASGEKRH